jgi:hypothetical protein
MLAPPFEDLGPRPIDLPVAVNDEKRAQTALLQQSQPALLRTVRLFYLSSDWHNVRHELEENACLSDRRLLGRCMQT